MRSRLTKVDDVETLSGQISQLAREADLVVRSVEQQRDSVGDQFAQVLVRVVITGSYKQIEDFFRRVGAQPRLMAVPRFDMREPIIKDEQVSLTAECYIAVLRDLKLEEKTAVAKR
jgi:Tfp pilus assembly protein PilO